MNLLSRLKKIEYGLLLKSNPQKVNLRVFGRETIRILKDVFGDTKSEPRDYNIYKDKLELENEIGVVKLDEYIKKHEAEVEELAERKARGLCGNN